ncbi:MAG TPA: hypothetical protein VK952_03060 [Methylotenera sp.]|nr:hypothetical protein [Methylotenera sp.]
MENRGLVLLSKFSVSARRLIGVVNPAKLIKDSEYSAQIFQKVSEMGDEELILLSLEVQNMLGMMAVSATPAATKVVPIKAVEAVEQKKYMYGARS